MALLAVDKSPRPPRVEAPPPRRWPVALAGVAAQMMLGTVYAWSALKRPLLQDHPAWAEWHVGLTFALAIFCLGLGAVLGGRFVDRAGARAVAALAAVLFGGGTLLAGLASQTGNLWLLWAGYGVIGGLGNGLGYVTPVAVLVRWFPDRKGVMTGLAVMGFGLGAAGMYCLVPTLVRWAGMGGTFYLLGGAFLLGLLAASRGLGNPPPSWQPPATASAGPADPAASLTFRQARARPQFYLLWAMLFLNVAAGIALLSNLQPMAQDLLKPLYGLSPAAALSRGQGPYDAIVRWASLVGLAAMLCNGIGRLLWAWLSDRIGRRGVFLLLFLTQPALFLALPSITNIWLFAAAACYIMLCYGGGFGTMPAFTAETFGPRNVGAIYGPILTAWGLAGGVGPLLMEWFKGRCGSFGPALMLAAGFLVAGLVVALLYRRPNLSADAANTP